MRRMIAQAALWRDPLFDLCIAVVVLGDQQGDGHGGLAGFRTRDYRQGRSPGQWPTVRVMEAL